MIRYLIVAAALKAFSATPQTRRLYRRLGNRVGARARLHRGLPVAYLERARRIWEICARYSLAPPGAQLLELGTGWLHWESICIRLLCDAEITLYDVWDNRQLEALKGYFATFLQRLDDIALLSTGQRMRAASFLESIAKVGSFEELYCLLGFRYLVEPSGTLQCFPDHAFDAVFSSNVLEHVDRAILPQYVRDIARVLKAGGFSVHRIDIGDHLSYYDGSVSKKNYLRYSDHVWRRWFENQVQYFNRVQRSGWLQLFQEAGLELVEEETEHTDIAGLPVSSQYAEHNRNDLACTVIRVVHRKPGEIPF